MDKKETVTRFDFVESDKRIIDQKLRKHAISHTEHQRILKSVADDKDASEELVVCRDVEAAH